MSLCGSAIHVLVSLCCSVRRDGFSGPRFRCCPPPVLHSFAHHCAIPFSNARALDRVLCCFRVPVLGACRVASPRGCSSPAPPSPPTSTRCARGPTRCSRTRTRRTRVGACLRRDVHAVSIVALSRCLHQLVLYAMLPQCRRPGCWPKFCTCVCVGYTPHVCCLVCVSCVSCVRVCRHGAPASAVPQVHGQTPGGGGAVHPYQAGNVRGSLGWGLGVEGWGGVGRIHQSRGRACFGGGGTGTEGMHAVARKCPLIAAPKPPAVKEA